MIAEVILEAETIKPDGLSSDFLVTVAQGMSMQKGGFLNYNDINKHF